MNITEIGSLLKTQDNRITADPIFMVQERHRVYGLNPEFSDDCEWRDVDSGDYVPATPEQAPELDRLLSANLPTYIDDVEFDQIYYTDIWINVQPFFTEAAAQQWISNNQHNYERPLRIYAESAHNNPEWKAIRRWLMLKARSDSDYARRRVENKLARQEAEANGMMYCSACQKAKTAEEMNILYECKQCNASRVNRFLHSSGKLKSYRPGRRKYPADRKEDPHNEAASR